MILELRDLTAHIAHIPDNSLFSYPDGLRIERYKVPASTHTLRYIARITKIFPNPEAEITRIFVEQSHTTNQYGFHCGTSLRISLGYPNGGSTDVEYWEDLDEMPNGYATITERQPATAQETSYMIAPTYLGEKISVRVALNGGSHQSNYPIGSHYYGKFLRETMAITQKAIRHTQGLLSDVRRAPPYPIQEN